MTLDEYMNAERFPMTSHPDYSPIIQLQMDAFNLDAMEEAIEEGRKMNQTQAAAYKELKIKGPHIDHLVEELRNAEVAQQTAEACRSDSQNLTRDEVLDLISRNKSILDEEANNANTASSPAPSGMTSPLRNPETDGSV